MAGTCQKIPLTPFSRTLLGDQRLTAFLRWIANDPEVLACQLINRSLNEGETLESILSKRGDCGYILEVEENAGEGEWLIRFGCLADPAAGDGGEWNVKFNAAGEVVEAFQTGSWIN